MTAIRILNAREVTACLPMPEAIEAMRSAFSQFCAGRTTVPLRGQLPTEKGVSLLMPAYLRKSGDLGIKVVSIYPDNPGSGLPTISATVLVLDPQTGVPLALMDGASLTAIRTGAAGGLAADLLAPADARTMALFGAGVQARTQLMAVLAVRNIRTLYLVDPFPEAAQRLADEVAGWPNAPEVRITADAGQAVRDAGIVVTATTSPTPVFDGSDLAPGTHVTAVGSFQPHVQEIDATTVDRSTVVVDSRDMSMEEAGDLIIPNATIDAEIGEIINGDHPGRQSAGEITLFKTVGVAIQDAAAAAAVLHHAEKENMGTVVEL
jgi:ornithine cyclodeaminase/alanine dehydrogenase-like protein (mu-crystallin family)